MTMNSNAQLAIDDVILVIRWMDAHSMVFSSDEQMVSSVLERIEKLEESNAKLEKMCAENQATHAQSNSVKVLEQEIHQVTEKPMKVSLSCCHQCR